jgi:hypothetical protein
MNPLIDLKKATSVFLVAFGLACFVLSPAVRAISPLPDGGYADNNTAEGTNALFTFTGVSPNNGGENTAIGFEALYHNTGGNHNTASGFQALFSNTVGSANTASGHNALASNTTGSNNMANGGGVLASNTTGNANTASGHHALNSNTRGSNNTADGADALSSNTTGIYNTAVGYFSLRNDTINSYNTAVGAGALLANTADGNTATGALALLSNTTGTSNTANGALALFRNTTGNDNTATGFQALYSNTVISGTPGGRNTANGVQALYSNTNGSENTATGYQALYHTTVAGQNTAVGDSALLNNTTGVFNLALGHQAGLNVTTASSTICIGHPGVNVDNSTWISNVYGVTTQSGMTAPVIVSNAGQLGTVVSSERFKKDIAAMDKASEAIMSLRPVTFHYKTDTKGTPQFGLIAEEVAKVNPALVLPDKEGKPYTVRYDQVNAMLLNEFLKEHHKVEQLTKDFELKIAEQQKQIEALTVGLQKVSAQLEASKPAPQVVNNP